MKFGFSRARSLARAASDLRLDDDTAAAATVLATAARTRAEAEDEPDPHVVVEADEVEPATDVAPAAETEPAPEQHPAPAPAGDAAATAARAEGHSAGRAEAHTRMSAVFASEHFAGREALACDLLCDSDMAADKIVATLAKTPKAGANDMLGSLGSTPNPDLGAGAESQTRSGTAVWDKIRGRN